jgi:hydrogenase nickel incorporation protein HypA/HybF
MHELSIAMGILELTEEESEKRGGVHVDAIHVRLGALSGVVKEALLSAWQLASEQTDFETSRLVIEDVPIAIYCSKCRTERPVRSIQQMSCVECDTPSSDVMHGRELLVSGLELAE